MFRRVLKRLVLRKIAEAEAVGAMTHEEAEMLRSRVEAMEWLMLLEIFMVIMQLLMEYFNKEKAVGRVWTQEDIAEAMVALAASQGPDPETPVA